MEYWLSLITDISFPIIITFYLLSRIEGKLNQLIKSIDKLPGRLRLSV